MRGMRTADLPDGERELAQSVVTQLRQLAQREGNAAATDGAHLGEAVGDGGGPPAGADDGEQQPGSTDDGGQLAGEGAGSGQRPDRADGGGQLAGAGADGGEGQTSRAASGAPAMVPVKLEWSQAGTQHSGRLVVGSGERARRVQVPEQVTAALAQLRAQMARPGAGTWLSMLVRVDGDDSRWGFNYSLRPYWNSTGDTMLERPRAEPVPDETRWSADVRRFPRDEHHLLDWLALPAVSGRTFAGLREALGQAGYPAGGLALPDNDYVPFEGTVTVVRHSSAHYSLQIIDYARREFLAEYGAEDQVARAAWDYLHQPLPAPTPMARAELHQRAQAAQHSYADLGQRLHRAEPGGVITNLAAGVPFDRIGVLDGLYFFPWQTPWPQRSLPESARGPGAQHVVLIAPAPVEAHAELVPGWFGQPGGGIRFRVEGAKHQGLRDLVRAGVLVQVHPVE